MRKYSLLLLFIGIGQLSFSQIDSLHLASTIDRNLTKGNIEDLYNGREHVPYSYSIVGTAYYGTGEWQRGSIILQEVPYHNLFLKYDLVADEVILLHSNGFTGVTLFTPRIQSFTLENRRFVRMAANDASGLKAGIYEELSKGNTSLYAKRTKSIQETILSNTLERRFIGTSSYFVFKDGQFYPIRNEKAIRSLLSDQIKELDEWMKVSGINFKSDPENFLIKILEYYHQISR
ncbi:MAG: hypothetical protein EOO53_20125 [Gammaproteobacteria bacterium]|nr:MAG: hypothetical protein EOO53_20125 [Gammaproteobacteria bacterium]